MIYIDIINNAALLLILGILQSLIHHRWIRSSVLGQVVRGILFGAVALSTMMSPLQFNPGVIFDGRSVVLSIGGLFGGPIVAGISAIIASAYRIYLGGSGAFTGVGSILISAGGGVIFRYMLKDRLRQLSFMRLLIFGLIIHSILVLWFVTLPGDIYLEVLSNIAIAYLTVFPAATAILGNVIVDQELRFYAEERSRVNLHRFRTLIETAPDIILTIDRDGHIYFINKIPSVFAAQTHEESNIFDLIFEDSITTFKAMLERVYQRQAPQYGEFAVITSSGGKAWYTVSANLIDEGSSAQHLILVARDITTQKQNDALIEQRNQEIRILYEINQMISSSLDINTIYDHLYEGISQMMDCDHLMISSYEPDKKMICYAYGRLDGEQVEIEKLPLLSLEKEGMGVQSQVIHERKPILIKDIQKEMSSAANAFYVTGKIPVYDSKHADQLTKNSQKVVVRSGILVPIVLENEVVGIIQVFSRQLNAYSVQDIRIMQALAAQVAVASNNAKLYRDLRASTEDLFLAYDRTLEGWSTALQMREKETAGHTKRVAELSMLLAERLGIPEEERIHIWRGALLHDIGKLVIPDDILHKTEYFDEKEWETIKQHPIYAYEWLSPIEYLRPALDIPYSHHERWNGSGYPQGLSGESIPLAARMFAVIDVYDALSSDRPYRKAWLHENVLQYIKEQAGTEFDPAIVAVFLDMIQELDHVNSIR